MNTEKIEKQFNSIAKDYDSQRKCFIPCFDDYYTRSISLLKSYNDKFNTILDLGAGTGLLTMEIYKLYNKAHFTLIDVSNDMLEVARKRFEGLNNFDFIAGNYTENIPADTYDLICSALSIHHLENNDKVKLYTNIYANLEKSGCFINLDQFRAKSGKIDTLYNEWWCDYVGNSGITAEEKTAWLERRKLDRENSIEETVDILRAVGFNDVECIYSFMKFGVIIAIK